MQLKDRVMRTLHICTVVVFMRAYERRHRIKIKLLIQQHNMYALHVHRVYRAQHKILLMIIN